MVLPGTTRLLTVRVALKRAGEDWNRIGDQALFYWDSITSIPRAVRLYKKETLRLIAEISMGTGALAMIGGTVVVVGFLTLFTGGTIAVQGYSSLANIGVEALTGSDPRQSNLEEIYLVSSAAVPRDRLQAWERLTQTSHGAFRHSVLAAGSALAGQAGPEYSEVSTTTEFTGWPEARTCSTRSDSFGPSG